MEPADIDWESIESDFVPDEQYEVIDAPMWVDFLDPGQPVNEASWFCRSDCRHPKTVEDFKAMELKSESKPERLPLGERNRRDGSYKRRGPSSAIPSLTMTKPEKTSSPSKPPKKFRDNGENENPNSASSPAPIRLIPKAKVLKDSIKSSAEKPKKDYRNQNQNDSGQIVGSPREQKTVPRLRSTLSARNLFGGRDILNHVTEFCNELKKLAFAAKEKEKSAAAKERAPLVEEGAVSSAVEEEQRANVKKDLHLKIFSSHSWKKRQIERQTGGRESHAISKDSSNDCRSNSNVLQVRSCPPTPQRFPSPSRPTKPPRTSPNKLPKAIERSALQEVEQISTPVKESKAEEDGADAAVGGDVARPIDVFWFLKPCTYLVK